MNMNGWRAIRTWKTSDSKQAIDGRIATVRVFNELQGYDEVLGGRRAHKAVAAVVAGFNGRQAGCFGLRSNRAKAESEARSMTNGQYRADYALAVPVEDVDE
jgi:hypothetical protein